MSSSANLNQLLDVHKLQSRLKHCQRLTLRSLEEDSEFTLFCFILQTIEHSLAINTFGNLQLEMDDSSCNGVHAVCSQLFSEWLY